MKYVILLSALPLSQVRLFKKEILEKKYKTYLDHVFKGKDRLYLDFKQPTKKPTKVPVKLKKYLDAQQYEVVDYNKGLVKKKDKKNFIKVGKVLKKEPELLKLYNEDPNREGIKKNNLLIVISRHPYDIAGMSTGRGWTSCMNLDSKDEKSEYIWRDIKHGTLIAYVIDANDKNITKPVSRLLMKPFINVKNKKKVILYPDLEIRGTKLKGFREAIIKWLSTFQKIDKAIYRVHPRLYKDGGVPNQVGEYAGDSDKTSKDPDIRYKYY